LVWIEVDLRILLGTHHSERKGSVHARGWEEEGRGYLWALL
jgi:hypothetical protein